MDHQPITDDQLREIREALSKATPAPWRSGVSAPCITGVWGATPEANWNVCWTGDEMTRYSLEDADLIAKAPEWLAALCDEVERLKRAGRYLAKSERRCAAVSVASQREALDWKARAEEAEAALGRVRSEQMHAVKTLAIATMGVGGEVSITQFIGYPEPRDAQLLVIQLPEQEAPTDEALDGE